MNVDQDYQSNTFSLSEFFARTITSANNQHVSMVTVGRTGKGKSNANLTLGYNIAKKVAELKGGVWQDYFNIDHVAIITKEEVLRVMRINKKYAVILLDDIGVGYSSRSWQKEENTIMNEIIQTFRTDNSCLLMTLPDQFMLDKIPRSLSHWYMEMELAIFEKGITIAKVFELVRKPRVGKTHYEYPVWGGSKYIRAMFKLAPDEIRIPYEKKRTEIAKQLKEQRLLDYENRLHEADGTMPKDDKSDKFLESYEKANEYVKEGMTRDKAWLKAGIKPSTGRYRAQTLNLPPLGEY